MASKYTYVVTDDPDDWGNGDEYTRPNEAKLAAARRGACVVEIEWEFSDSELIEDYRDDDDEEDLPCERSDRTEEPDGTVTWNCDNDHTGCLWNDGNNGCSHPGESLTPLED